MCQKLFLFKSLCKRLLSYWLFSWRNTWTHFRMNITKKKYFFLIYIFLHTLTNYSQSVHQKESFFHFSLSRYCRFRRFFFQKRFISKFFCRQLCPSCDLLLESSWGVNPRYIYFYGPKTFPFSCKESYHIHCYRQKKIPELTFAWILPKSFFFFLIYMFLHTLTNYSQSVHQKESFFHFSLSRYCRFRRFFSKRDLYLSFSAGHFAHHVTYCWKALEE